MITRLTLGDGEKTRIMLNQGGREWVFVGYATELELATDDYMDDIIDGHALRMLKPRRSVTISLELDEMYCKDLVPVEETEPVLVEAVFEDDEDSSDIPDDWKIL